VPLGILYQLFVAQGLLGEWTLIREWGRVGSTGTMRKAWFETEDEAITARQTLYDAKQKKAIKLFCDFSG